MKKAYYLTLSILILTTIPFSSTTIGQIGPVVLSNVELVTVSEDTAVITWVTNLQSDTRVEWGLTEDLGEEKTVDESLNYHMASIDDLEQGTKYFYRIGSGGSWSQIENFTTLTDPGGGFEIQFALVADPHYDVDGQNTANGNMNEDSVQILRSLIEELNDIPDIDFVIVNGDLTNGAQEDFQGFGNDMSGLNVEWHPVVGNWEKTEDGWYDWYTNSTGYFSTYYSFDKGGYHMVVLDSAVQGEIAGELDEEQLLWLEDDLDSIGEKPTILFLHHMITTDDIYGITQQSKDALDAILSSRPNVFSIFSGHLHKNSIYAETQDRINMTTAATVTYPIGYSIVRLYGNGYTQAFHKIKETLATSEESRIRMNTFSGNPNSDEDYLGELGERSIVMEIPEDDGGPSVGNERPIIRSITASMTILSPDSKTTITVDAYDPDGDTLTYSYAVTGGTTSGTGETVTYHAPSTDGTYTITVTVSDGELKSKEESVDISVRSQVNHPPELKEVTASALQVEQGASVTIEVEAFDEDDNPLTYDYQVSGGTISGSGAEVTWTAPDYPGDFIIKVTVSDGESTSDERSVTISVVKEEEDSEESPGFEAVSVAIILCAIVCFGIVYRKRI